MKIEDERIFSFDKNTGRWDQLIDEVLDNGEEGTRCIGVPITDVSLIYLLCTYEDLVLELSDKEVELYTLKEAYLIAEKDIIANTDFKSLYGANNQKVRDNHVKQELSDMVARKADLQLGIDFIKNYIPLLREVIRAKQ